MQTKIALALSFLLAAPAMAQDAAPTTWDGVFTAEQAERGHAAFEGHCAACHGAALNGGDMAPGLAGTEFLGRWSGQSAGDLFERIRSTMPPDDPGSLGGATVSDIEAYIFSQNQFPAGANELAHDAQLLGGVKILSTKPEGK